MYSNFKIIKWHLNFKTVEMLVVQIDLNEFKMYSYIRSNDNQIKTKHQTNNKVTIIMTNNNNITYNNNNHPHVLHII